MGKKLNIGDKVICVSNESVWFPLEWKVWGGRILADDLTVEKEYVIKELCENNRSDPGLIDYPKENYSVIVESDRGHDMCINAWRFLDKYKNKK